MSNFFINIPETDQVTVAGPIDVIVTGPVEVVVLDPDISGPYVVKNVFNTVASVASGATQTIVSYTVPTARKSFLVRATFGGQNIATYSLLLNNSPFDMKRTYFGSDLSESLEYTNPPRAGFQMNAGDTMQIQVNNFRPDASDFEGALYIIEVTI